MGFERVNRILGVMSSNAQRIGILGIVGVDCASKMPHHHTSGYGHDDRTNEKWVLLLNTYTPGDRKPPPVLLVAVGSVLKDPRRAPLESGDQRPSAGLTTFTTAIG
jgi:hypothetical protein